MDASHSNSDPSRRLRALMREAGLRSFRTDRGARIALFGGRSREWAIHYRMNEHWLGLSSFVCNLPAEPALRSRVMEHVLRENDRLTLVKFAANQAGLSLECECRTEHVGVENLNNLTGMMHSALEECYPAVFRIVSGDAVLAELDFKSNREAA